jgi:hypothetical protein
MLREQVSIQHRRAQAMGGTVLPEVNNLADLLVLCGSATSRGCHNWVENVERAAAEARGLWVRHEYRDDGTPVPVSEYPLVLWSGRRVLLHPSTPVYLPHPDEWGLVSGSNTAARIVPNPGNEYRRA